MPFSRSSSMHPWGLRSTPLVGKQQLRFISAPLFGAALLGALTVACGAAEPDASTKGKVQQSPPPPMTAATDGAPPTATMPEGSTSAPADGVMLPPGNTDGSDAILGNADEEIDVVEGMDCASADSPASLSKVVLAFVFDVSASMGAESEPFYSRALKWEPVVAATKAFFADPASAGISATLTFFPNEFASTFTQGGGIGMNPMDPTDPDVQLFFAGGGNGQSLSPDGVCEAAEYSTPDVPLTDLPSDAFAAAIDAVTPADENSWRLSTPTLPAIEGTIQHIEELRAADPSASYSIVLVTDGMPALCVEINDSVDAVAQAVGAVADTTPTYVIGVENPVTEEEPNPPPSVDGMNTVAESGGTGTAFVINTDDPVGTVNQFTEIINSIRESSFTCSLPIPEPPEGLDFDKEKVNVKFATAAAETPYEYDPDCAGTSGWRFDDEASPTSIELCPAACDALLAGLDVEGGALNVEFGCARRGVGSR